MKNYLGYIIIGVALVLSSIFISEAMKPDTSLPIYKTPNELLHSWKPLNNWDIPIKIKTNSNDLAYNSSLEIENGILEIVLTSGKKRIKGKKIKATFYHIGNLLLVEYLDKNENSMIEFFKKPLSWKNIIE